MTMLAAESGAYKTPRDNHPTLSLLGVHLVQPRVTPNETNEQFAVFEVIQAPGSAIPLHSHPAVEWMYVLEGTVQVLTYRDGHAHWLDVTPGESLVVPTNARHALRNATSETMRLLCMGPTSIWRFFEEVARPTGADGTSPELTLDWQRELLAAASRHGYWMASPQENAAVGLVM